IKSVETNLGGVFTEPAPLSGRKIEFIGDSITCGYGNIPPYNLAELTSAIEDGTRTYGYFISEHFNTDSRYICVSGAPVYRNYLGNVGDFFKRYSWNDYNDDLPYDFTGWTPDLVIINLGTNDVGEGSTYDEFIANGKKWISYIRKNYPDAFIIWTYGVMNQQNIPRIKEIVTYFNDQGDKKIYFHELAPMDTITDGTGGGGHPTYKTHQKMADSLIPVIKSKMGW
ncbi:MAG: SGNH/GDSL hydrolase family protein, partial [Saccharofermentanales bacterium]